MRNEPIEIDYTSWDTDSLDSLTLYYIERPYIPSIDELLENTQDSIFVKDYSQKNVITLKNSSNYIVHFFNNITLNTLRCFSYFQKTDQKEYYNLFIKNADWLVENASIVEDSIALWQNKDFIYDKYNLAFGWSSAFGQGLGLSVLCRAYQIFQNEKYLVMGEKALNSFNLDYKKGGISDIDDNGYYWYLEYPADPPGYVLNGMIFGLFGIYDYYRITGSEKALKYFERGIQTLENNLDLYDKGYWSAYDLEYNTCAGFNYHKNVHIPQLIALYDITHKKVFKNYAEKFSKYLNEPWLTIYKMQFTIEAFRRRLTYKNPFKHLSKKRFQ